MMDTKKLHSWFWLLPLAIFCSTYLPLLLMHGLPDMDGLVYAILARNMAQGLGSFWQPYFSQFHAPAFYEHPALSIAWLSYWYRLFGDHDYVEKIYTFLVTALNWGLLYAIAKRFIVGLRWKQAWTVWLLWLMVPVNAWYFSSNMLEPVANVFAMLALYLIVLSYQRQSCGYGLMGSMLIAGVATCIGFYVNGPLILYVWLVEPCLWLAYRRIGWRAHGLRWCCLVISSLLCMAVFVPAHANFMQYWHQQVLAALLGQRTESVYFGFSRLYVVRSTLLMLLPTFLVFYLVSLSSRNKFTHENKRHALFLILLFLASLLPITLSSKQHYHYALQAYPFAGLAMLVLIFPTLTLIIENLATVKLVYRLIKAVLMLLLLAALLFLWRFVFVEHRSIGNIYKESEKIVSLVGAGATLSVPMGQMYVPLPMETYLQRYGHIDLVMQYTPSQQYLINMSPKQSMSTFPGYKLVSITRGFRHAKLYRK